MKTIKVKTKSYIDPQLQLDNLEKIAAFNIKQFFAYPQKNFDLDFPEAILQIRISNLTTSIQKIAKKIIDFASPVGISLQIMTSYQRSKHFFVEFMLLKKF